MESAMCCASGDTPGSFGGEFPSTHKSIIRRLKDPHGPEFRAALDKFLGDRRPALYTRLRQGGLQSSHADEVIQLFFEDCLDPEKSVLSRYNPEKGKKFRHFLLKCLRNRMLKWIRDRNARPEHGAVSLSPDEEAERDLGEVLAHPRVMEPDEEWDRIWFWQTFENSVDALAGRQSDPMEVHILREWVTKIWERPSAEDFVDSLNASFKPKRPMTVGAMEVRATRLRDLLGGEILAQIGREYAEGETPENAVEELLSLLARHPPKKGYGDERE